MPITYEDLRSTLILGRGLVIDAAPQHAKLSIGVLAQGHFGIRYLAAGCLRFGEQVEYEITGYDPSDHSLTLHLVHDWRPGQKDDPHASPADV